MFTAAAVSSYARPTTVVFLCGCCCGCAGTTYYGIGLWRVRTLVQWVLHKNFITPKNLLTAIFPDKRVNIFRHETALDEEEGCVVVKFILHYDSIFALKATPLSLFGPTRGA